MESEMTCPFCGGMMIVDKETDPQDIYYYICINCGGKI